MRDTCKDGAFMCYGPFKAVFSVYAAASSLKVNVYVVE